MGLSRCISGSRNHGCAGLWFRPGATNIYCAYARKHLFDEIEPVDIFDCNDGHPGTAEVSPGHLGVFTTAPIPRGAIIIPDWHGALDLGMEGWAHLTLDEMASLPGHQNELFIRYGLDEDFSRIAGPLDARYVLAIDNFINHSCEPNLRYDFDGNVVTGEDVGEGVELRIDYGCFAVNLDEGFACECGAAACRGRVTKDDWKLLARSNGLAMPRFLASHIRSLTTGRM